MKNQDRIKSVTVYEDTPENCFRYVVGDKIAKIRRHYPAGEGDYHSVTIYFRTGEKVEFFKICSIEYMDNNV